MPGRVRGAVALNVCKALVLNGLLIGLFGGLGWLLGEERTASLFVLCGLLAGVAAYWLGDRAVLGMLGARPFAVAESPLLRAATDRVAAASPCRRRACSSSRTGIRGPSSSDGGRAARRSRSRPACSTRSGPPRWTPS